MFMKNLLNLFTLVFFVFSVSFGQDKGYIAISLGPSFATGDFASTNMDNKSAGFAKTGAIFDITFAYKLNKNFGVSALLRGQANKTDAQAFADEMIKQIPMDNVAIRTETGSWGIGALLLGGFGSFPIQKDLSFEPRVMVGFASATSPGLTFNIDTPEGSAWVKQSSATATDFAYLFGMGVKYNAGKRVCILGNIDYFGSKPNFKNVELTDSFGDVYKDDYLRPLGSINLGIGIGYRL
jgi:hypothetical protein